MAAPRAKLRLGILASGSGTNFDAIADSIDRGEIPAEIVLMATNRPSAAVKDKAVARGLPTAVLQHTDYPDRKAFDRAIAKKMQDAGVELIAMAGFDRLVTEELLLPFRDRVMNVHPALLPAFKGTEAQGQAAEYGVTISGATVHFVDEDVDHGPIIIQAAIPVTPGETSAAVQQRILAQEHRIYPYAIRLFAEGRLTVHGRHVTVTPGIDGPTDDPANSACLVWPPLPN